MFSFPQESLSTVEFVFGGRSIPLQKQDFGLGGIKDSKGQMCSSIVQIENYPFQDDLWIIVSMETSDDNTRADSSTHRVAFSWTM
jgi:hypothetical protein